MTDSSHVRADGRGSETGPARVDEECSRPVDWRRRGTPILTVVNADGSTPNGSLTDEIVRDGARRMLAAALEADVSGYIAELAGERDGDRRRLIVRNGYNQPRKVTTQPPEQSRCGPRA